MLIVSSFTLRAFGFALRALSFALGALSFALRVLGFAFSYVLRACAMIQALAVF